MRKAKVNMAVSPRFPKALSSLVDNEVQVQQHPVSALPPAISSRCHCLSLSKLGLDLASSLRKTLGDEGRRNYKAVQVLMLSWNDNDTSIQKDMKDLQRVLEERFGFRTECLVISNVQRSNSSLEHEIFMGIRSHDAEDGLTIVYYGGSSNVSIARNRTLLQSGKSPVSRLELLCLNWSSIEERLDACRNDILFILDCCYMPSTTKLNPLGSRELLAACGGGSHATCPDSNAFTRTLICELESLSHQCTFTAAELHALIIDKQNFYGPLHMYLFGRYAKQVKYTLEAIGILPKLKLVIRAWASIRAFTRPTSDGLR